MGYLYCHHVSIKSLARLKLLIMTTQKYIQFNALIYWLVLRTSISSSQTHWISFLGKFPRVYEYNAQNNHYYYLSSWHGFFQLKKLYHHSTVIKNSILWLVCELLNYSRHEVFWLFENFTSTCRYFSVPLSTLLSDEKSHCKHTYLLRKFNFKSSHV